MLSRKWRVVSVALVLTAVSGQAVAYGWDRGWHGRGHGYHGYKHRHHSGPSRGVWIGGAALLGAGALLAFNSQPRSSVTYIQSSGFYGPGVSYSTPVYAAPVYPAPVVQYVAPPVQYVAPPVQYVNPPVQYANPPVVASSPQPQYAPASVSTRTYTASASDVVAYPANGQDGNKQISDRQACEAWAKNYSGFDPAYVTQYTTSAMTDSYQRALGACYKGRGYSIN